MRVIAFEAENFAKLKAVAIRPDKSLVQITGKNRNGKTSVLNALWTVLAGKSVAPPKPIREGETQARIRVELGDTVPELIVTRRFKATENGEWTTDLRVEGAEGQKFTSPQDVLSALLGAFTFDPLAFARMDDEDRLAALRPLVPEVDFDALKAANKADYEARTAANRVAKEKRAQAEGVAVPPGAVPARVDVAALEEELAGVAEFNADIETRKANRNAAIRQIEEIEARETELRQQLEVLGEQREALQQRLAKAAALPEPKDLHALRAKLGEARSGNIIVEKSEQRAALNAEAAEAEAKSKALSEAIEARDAQMAGAVAKALSAVPGLSWAGDRMLLNGQPFDQASDAEQLEAAILIAGLLNPTLRVVRVRDGSLLDEDALAAVEAMAERLDLQVWIERVDSSGAVGFVLEDGEIKGPGTAPAARAAPPVAAEDEEAI